MDCITVGRGGILRVERRNGCFDSVDDEVFMFYYFYLPPDRKFSGQETNFIKIRLIMHAPELNIHSTQRVGTIELLYTVIQLSYLFAY